MSSGPINKASSIVIVGTGVFGLSMAIHLAERGYTNVKLLDKQGYQESQYSYNKGWDAASAQYQALALDAISHWKRWNKETHSGQTLPPELLTKDMLFINNGSLTMTTDDSLPQLKKDTIENMTNAGSTGTQVLLSSPSDVNRATANGFGFAVNAFNLKNNFGVLDTQGGFVYADRACRFALHKAEALGTRVVLGGSRGTFSTFISDGDSRIVSVPTADGVSHFAELTIMACGGWTPSLVIRLDNLCETTAGSVCVLQLPAGSPMWDHFSPENFPTCAYVIRSG